MTGNYEQYAQDQIADTYRRLSQQDSGYFECQLPVIRQTEKAVCFDADSGHLNRQKPVWIPKSQMEILDFSFVHDTDTRYFIKNWLYKNFK